jgi:hypothetical protein
MSKEDTTKISQEVQDLSKKIKDQIKLDGDKVTVPADLYVTTLSEGLTEDTVKAVQKHNSTFFPAVTLAVGDIAVAAMKKDKKLEVVTGEFKMVGRDHFDVTINRTKEARNPSNGETITKYGSVSATMTTHSAQVSRGEMSHVKTHLQEAALKAFGE